MITETVHGTGVLNDAGTAFVVTFPIPWPDRTSLWVDGSPYAVYSPTVWDELVAAGAFTPTVGQQYSVNPGTYHTEMWAADGWAFAFDLDWDGVTSPLAVTGTLTRPVAPTPPGGPTVEQVEAYLTSISASPPDPDALADAYAAEKAAQAAICDIPTTGWPGDLAEALMRRVAVNLHVRNLPLGVQTTSTEAAVGIARVGGGDREVDRLEAPYRSIAIA